MNGSHALRIRVTGRVQGVFFRRAAKEYALELGLTGIIRNQPDGSVMMEVEGAQEALENFVVWCNVGPIEATVKEVVARPMTPMHRKGIIVD